MERFLTYVRIERSELGGCWMWLGGKTPQGYGKLFWGVRDGRRVTVPAHRAAWELLRGDIHPDKHLDHLCRNRACVNPAHLEPVTCRENIMRSPVAPAAVNSRRSECKHGHALAGENLWIRGTKRTCRACFRARDAKYKREARARKIPTSTPAGLG